jgi:hypothetical protein
MNNRTPRLLSNPRFKTLFTLAAALIASGCSTKPQLTRTGFLSNYSSLEQDGANRLRYVSPDLTTYNAFIVDPVTIDSYDDNLTTSERAEITRYCRETFIMVIHDRGYRITTLPGPCTARLRIALTSIQDSVWWKKVHPASNILGAGRGGAAMEAEIVDSNSGQQVAAIVQTGVGSQFKAFNITTVSDVKNTIDVWARDVGDHMQGRHVRR